MIRFYCKTMSNTEQPAPALARDLSVRMWRPASDGLPSYRRAVVKNLGWLTLRKLSLFANDNFAEMTIWRGDDLLHRLIVTPGWLRFPFMREDDLQIGDLWTLPALRGQGLARSAIALAEAHFAADARRFWYVVDEANIASVRLIESCGYKLMGTGRRTAPLRFRFAGAFRIEHRLT